MGLPRNAAKSRDMKSRGRTNKKIQTKSKEIRGADRNLENSREIGRHREKSREIRKRSREIERHRDNSREIERE